MDGFDETLERSLHDAYRVEPPAALRERLLAIAETPAAVTPAARDRTRRPRRGLSAWPSMTDLLGFEWRLAVPAFAVAAAVAVLWVAGNRGAPDDAAPLAGTAPSGVERAADAEAQQAIRDFVVVMNYLQAATARAHRGVQGEIGTGLSTAFDRGEQSFTELSKEITNGG